MLNYDFLRMFLFCLDDNVCNFHKNDEFFSEGVKLSLSNYLISLPNLIIRWLNPTCNYFISKNNDSVYVTLQFSENFLFPLSFGMDQTQLMDLEFRNFFFERLENCSKISYCSKSKISFKCTMFEKVWAMYKYYIYCICFNSIVLLWIWLLSSFEKPCNLVVFVFYKIDIINFSQKINKDKMIYL